MVDHAYWFIGRDTLGIVVQTNWTPGDVFNGDNDGKYQFRVLIVQEMVYPLLGTKPGDDQITDANMRHPTSSCPTPSPFTTDVLIPNHLSSNKY